MAKIKHRCGRSVNLTRTKVQAELPSIRFTWFFEGECNYCKQQGCNAETKAIQHVYMAEASNPGELRSLTAEEYQRWKRLDYEQNAKKGIRRDIGDATKEIKRDPAEVHQRVIKRYA